MSKIDILKKALRNSVGLSKNEKIVFVLNYHRIGKIDKENPFHRLHSVEASMFKKQINLLRSFGKFVSPADINNFEQLGRFNFCITFDDVSSSVLSVTPFLDKKSIPYTIAPCVWITEKGYGIRDKVYFINHHISQEKLFTFAKENFSDTFDEPLENFSFYSFTKDTKYDLLKIHREIVEPLFDNLSEEVKNIFFKERQYLSWSEIKEHYLNNDLVTIANHSLTHHNLVHFGKSQVREEIEQSIAKFQKHLNIQPSYFSVPFGQPSQNLAVDLNEILREKNYKGVFWVTGQANKYSSKTPNQLLHFHRIHAPVKYLSFLLTTILSLSKASRPIRKCFFKSWRQESSNISIIGSREESPLLAIENLLREGRDYASSLDFYKYYFKNNQHVGNQTHYFASVANERIEAIGANLYYTIKAEKQVIPSAIWSNWRKLPYANNLSGGLILRKALKNTAILVAYKSSSQAQTAYKGANWKKVQVTRLTWEPQNKSKPSSSENIGSYNNFPEILIPLIEKFNEKNIFTVHRTQDFYQWRYDQYPLANRKYILLQENNRVKSFCVILYNDTIASVSDFIYNEIDDFSKLLHETENIILQLGIKKITLETNQNKVINLFSNKNLVTKEQFWNFYHFNKRNEQLKTILPAINQNWEKEEYHYETRAAGDVFIRTP